MFFLLTDYGDNGPYTGQIKSILIKNAPGVPIIDLFNNLPSFRPDLSSYLIPAYTNNQIKGGIFLCIVDPGVGGSRRPLVIFADDRWYVGPDNGLFSQILRQAMTLKCWEIKPISKVSSKTFHGRDIFAPIAAKIFSGSQDEFLFKIPIPEIDISMPADTNRIIYIDHFGNLITGIRGNTLPFNAKIKVGSLIIDRAETYGDVEHGKCFWYINSNGLIEVAASRQSAKEILRLDVGDSFSIYN